MSRLNQKGIAHLLMLIILLIGLGVGLYVLKNPTMFKSKAAQPPILDALRITDSTTHEELNCDGNNNPPTCEVSSPGVTFQIKNINALILNNSGSTSNLFQFSTQVYAQENSTKTCAEGNCNACETQSISVCGNQNAYVGECDYETACKNNPNGKYTCRSSQNPNGCSFDQYDCSLCNSAITGKGYIDETVSLPATKTCAQGNCSACATETLPICGNQNVYAGDCDYATACKNNPQGKYTCRAFQNPNGCSFDQYDCSLCDASITGSERSPVPTTSPPSLPNITVTSVTLDINGQKTTLGLNYSHSVQLPISDLTQESTVPIKIDVIYSDNSSRAFYVTFHYKPLIAQSSPMPISSNTACISTSGLPIKVPVLVLEYYPPDPKNSNLLDGVETGWKQDASVNGRTLQFWESKTQEMISKGIEVVNDATRYHGYKDPSAPQFLNYWVLDDKKFYSPIPKGDPTLDDKGKIKVYKVDYGSILRGVNICDYVDNRGVKEVWMYGYHSERPDFVGITPAESKMSSKYGDVSNSTHDEVLSPQYRMPICNNSYVLYNFTYTPDANPGNNLHNRMHQLENIIPFAEGKDRYPLNSDNTKDGIFWGNFADFTYISFSVLFGRLVNSDGSKISGYKSACGNGHWPPNWTSMTEKYNTAGDTQEYHYDLNKVNQFSCEDWHPDRSKAKFITASCERWGCTDIGFYKWYMQNMPGYNNGIVYQGKKMRNWWEAMYDFNAFIDKGRSLFGDSIFCQSDN